MAEGIHGVLATLVRALKSSNDEWLPGLTASVTTLTREASAGSWAEVTKSKSDAFAALAPAGDTEIDVEKREAAVKAFCAMVAGSNEAEGSTSLIATLQKAARDLVRPGELADPVAARFWSTNFFTSTKAVPFATFMEKLLKSLRDGNAAPADLDRLSDAFTLEQSCLKPLRRSLIGNATDLHPLQLQDLLDESTSYSFPGGLLEVMRSAAAKATPLDAAFVALLENTELEQPKAVAHALQDAKLSLHNACKESTETLRTSFLDMGLCEADATRLAHRVFQEARKKLPVVVRAKSKLDRAREAIEELDDLVDMSHCQLRVDDARELFDMMRRTRHPSVVDLGGNNLHAEGAQHIVDLMKGLPRLRELRLGGNMLQLSGIRKVVEAAMDCPTLRILDLSCNHGQGESGALLAKLIMNTPLQVLRFNGNDLGASGIDLFANTLECCCPLQELVLGANAICDDGAKIYASKIAGQLPRLRSISLRGNGITDEGVAALVEGFGCQRNLRAVDLGNNAFGTAGTKQLAKAVDDGSVLHTVRVASCGTEESRQLLASACDARKQAMQGTANKLMQTPIAKWNTDEVATWFAVVLERPGYGMIARNNGINGMRLVAYSDRAMARDGIGMVEEREFVLNAVEAVQRGKSV